MGVPYLAAWLRRKYPHMICTTLPTRVHGLYIDLNGLIHPCCHDESNTAVGRRSEKEKLRQICFAIEMLVKSTLPQYVLYIAIDGVAPQAKMNQQRARRYMTNAWPVSTTTNTTTEGDNNDEENSFYKDVTQTVGKLNDEHTTSRSESGVDLSAIANEFTADETHAAEEELTEIEASLLSDPLYGNTTAVQHPGVTTENKKSNEFDVNVKAAKDAEYENKTTRDQTPNKKSYRDLGVAWLDSDDSENAFAGVPAESDFEEKQEEAKRSFDIKQRYAHQYEPPYKPPKEEYYNEESANYNGSNNPEQFDSNCISPGTEFMDHVSEAVQQFITNKLSSAQDHWRRLHVVFSDSNTPGEGEHKIIDFIRTQASHTHFNNHGCHVISGLDADLIFLALSLHLPQVYLLRDEGRAAQFGPLLPELEEEEEQEEEEELLYDQQNNYTNKNDNNIKYKQENEEYEEEQDKQYNVHEEDSHAIPKFNEDKENYNVNESYIRDKKKTTKDKLTHSITDIIIDANDSYEYFNIDVIAESLISEIYRLSLTKNAVDITCFHENIKNELIATNGYDYQHPPSLQRATHNHSNNNNSNKNTIAKGEVESKTITLTHPCCLPSNSKIIDDIIVLAMIMGNDFLPHIPSAICRDQAMENILEVYVQEVLPFGYLTEAHGAISTHQLFRFFSAYAKLEAAKFRHAAVVNQKMTAAEAAVPLGHAVDEQLYRIPYYHSTSIAPSEISQACAAYIDGMAFVWHYYCKIAKKVANSNHKEEEEEEQLETLAKAENENNDKNSVMMENYDDSVQFADDYAFDWSWYYPYHHAPFALDLADYLSNTLTNNENFLNDNHSNLNATEAASATTSTCKSANEQIVRVNNTKRERISAKTSLKFILPSTFAQLLCILPPSSASLLPQCLQALMTSKKIETNITNNSDGKEENEEINKSNDTNHENHKNEEEESIDNVNIQDDWKESTFPRRWMVDYTAAYQKEHLAAVMLPFANMTKLESSVTSLINEKQNDNDNNEEEKKTNDELGEWTCAQLSSDEKKRASNNNYHLVYFYEEQTDKSSAESEASVSRNTANNNYDSKNAKHKQQRKKQSKNAQKEYQLQLVGMEAFDSNTNVQTDNVITSKHNTNESEEQEENNSRHFQSSQENSVLSISGVVRKMKLYDVVPIIRRPRIYATSIAIPNLTRLPDGTLVKREREEMWFRRRGRRAKNSKKNKTSKFIDDEKTNTTTTTTTTSVQRVDDTCSAKNNSNTGVVSVTPIPYFAEFICATSAVVLLVFSLFHMSTPVLCVEFAFQFMALLAAILFASFSLGLTHNAHTSTSTLHGSQHIMDWSRNLRALWSSALPPELKDANSSKHTKKSLPPVLLRNTSRLAFIDWQCPLCLSLNFSSNVRCFICDAPFDEHRCMALASSKLPAIPPLFVGDHSRYCIPYELNYVTDAANKWEGAVEDNIHHNKVDKNYSSSSSDNDDDDDEDNDQISYFDDETINNNQNNNNIDDDDNDKKSSNEILNGSKNDNIPVK